MLWADCRAVLGSRVQEVLQQLVLHERPQEAYVTVPRKRPEHRGAVSVSALVVERLERVVTQPWIGNRGGSRAPHTDLTGNGAQTPAQLADSRDEQRKALRPVERQCVRRVSSTHPPLRGSLD